jgi:hypothetical protein
VLLILMPGKKVPEHCSGLHPSEKQPLKSHSAPLCHKNSPGYNSAVIFSNTHDRDCVPSSMKYLQQAAPVASPHHY